VASCSSCHTTRDAFDLAHFGFAPADIVRRARAHVSQETAEDISAYVQSLKVPAVGRDVRPFQPGTRRLASDEEFRHATFGTSGWPADLTPATIRAIDTRALNVAVALPLWSSEGDDSDWLPDVPLTSELLGAAQGVLASAIDTYHATPTTANLLAAIASFHAVSNAGGDALCYGEAATHTRPRECFEARRWVSTLAGQHFLRPGASAVPIEVAELWWSTGQAAVTVYQRELGHPRSVVWGWLYLGYSFAPTRFNEDNSYLGQFLESDGHPMLASFTALRRLVDEADVRNGLPAQRFWDAALAVSRAPRELRAGVAELSYQFLLDWLAAHTLQDPDARASARAYIDLGHERMLEATIEPAQLTRVTELRDLLLDRLR
jgi:hypothetical protein